MYWNELGDKQSGTPPYSWIVTLDVLKFGKQDESLKQTLVE